ncbi:MAG TPA: ABC transporter ATP-binding protein [Planctomycetota bacterium]|nr:ABC transporter ATP-binding protein [Planctomycetota bacterium]
MESVIATDIRKRYGASENAREVLKGASLRVDAGKSLAIMGPSGSGKSTLLNILGTLDTADSGSVDIFGQNPFALSEKELAPFRNRTIGFIFQAHHLLPQCSVLENVLLPTIVAKSKSSDARSSPSPLGGEGRGEGCGARATRLIERVGLTHRIHARPGQLSGGECQRAAVVRALINAPRLLLADEPTGSLDRASAESIGALLAEIVREERAALIAVTHSMELAQKMDAILELRDGALVPLQPESSGRLEAGAPRTSP